MSFFVEVGPEGCRELAVKYVVAEAGQAEGWKLVPEGLRRSDSFEPTLFESLLNES